MEKMELEIKNYKKKIAGCNLNIRRIEPDSLKNGIKLPVLVFLHEGLGCIRLWKKFPELICSLTGCPGLVYDRIGYGDSDCFVNVWSHDYHNDETKIYLPQLLDAEKIESSILIGHSDGGTIALLAAASTYPDRIKAVITEAAHIFVEDVTLKGIETAVEAFETGNLADKLKLYHGRHTEKVFFRWSRRWLSDSFRGWNIENRLADIRCPLMVIQGVDDPYATKAQVDGIANGVSGIVKVEMIPDCGHIPHFQAKETVSQKMAGFIKNLCADKTI
ncbi:alpha/beta hydrolase [Desulfobacterales bacterium HSG16]|nr:alpha/beta hydrolase [Desulfobacterales bacterium HSG16]